MVCDAAGEFAATIPEGVKAGPASVASEMLSLVDSGGANLTLAVWALAGGDPGGIAAVDCRNLAGPTEREDEAKAPAFL